MHSKTSSFKPWICSSLQCTGLVGILMSPLTSQAMISLNSTSDGKTDLNYNVVSLNSGAYLLNPYKIENTNQLARGDSEAIFYLEIAVDYVSAWNPHRRAMFAKDHLMNTNGQMRGWDGMHLMGWRDMLTWADFQGQISFFAGDEDSTTASAIVGAGDFSIETTVSIPLLMGLITDKSTLTSQALGDDLANLYQHTVVAHSINLVASYGGTTDRTAFDLHHRGFLGLGYRGAFKRRISGDPKLRREVLVSFQVGCAWIETTEFVDRSSRTIELEYGDIPKYSLGSGLGLEAEIYLPLSESAYVTFGSRVYGGPDPNPWSAYIGLTFSLDQLANLFK
jgi:hypothetical protein